MSKIRIIFEHRNTRYSLSYFVNLRFQFNFEKCYVPSSHEPNAKSNEWQVGYHYFITSIPKHLKDHGKNGRERDVPGLNWLSLTQSISTNYIENAVYDELILPSIVEHPPASFRKASLTS